MRCRFLHLLSLILAVGIGFASGAVIHVRKNAESGGDGTSWQQAFPSFQTALSAAVAGDEIWISQGIYTATNGTDREATFMLPGAVAIRGGFTGTETALDQRNPDTSKNPTILSGEIGDPEISTDNTLHIITALETGDTIIILDGVTITGGYDDDPSYNYGGAGIRGVSTNIHLLSCRFLQNHSSRDGRGVGTGGGAYFWKSDITIEKCEFIKNSSDGNAGALSTATTDLSIADSNFVSNSSGEGGALATGLGEIRVERCKFLANISRSDAGAIRVGSGNGTFIDCLFAGNRAGVSGGAIKLEETSPTFINCTITGNKCNREGGAVLSVFSTAKFQNCILWNNMAGISTATASSSFHNFNGRHYTKFSFSLVANSGGSDGWDDNFGTDQGNNVDLDPQFVAAGDPAAAPNVAGDYHLQHGSPAIGAGDAALNPSSLDLDGKPRIANGDGIDLGCYEYDASLLIPHEETLKAHRLLAHSGQTYDAAIDLAEIYRTGLDHVEIESVTPGSPFRIFLYQTGKATVRMSGERGFGEITFIVKKGEVEDRLTIRIEAISPVIRVLQEAAGLENGTTWLDAYPDLHPALLSAAGTTVGPLQEIWIGKGSYHPVAELSIPFELTDGVGLYGGFHGDESTLEERDIAANKSILTAATNPSHEEFSRPVLKAERVGARALMDGCTVIGHVYDPSSYMKNGATSFSLSRASPTMQSCEFRDSSTGNSGGAVYCILDSIRNCNGSE